MLLKINVKNLNVVSPFRFLKTNSLKPYEKHNRAIGFLKGIYKDTTFYLTYSVSPAKSLYVAGSTLHTAQCTLYTLPANAPASVPVHFILHIEHRTLHVIQLY